MYEIAISVFAARTEKTVRLNYALKEKITMFPVAPGIVVLGLILAAVIGWLVGMASGAITAVILGTGVRSIIKDGVLGLVGFLLATIAFTFMPWPRNTAVTVLEHGTQLESTMNRYQHPLLAGLVAASFLAVLHQLLRFKRLRSESKRA
jgi:hypothetical protein